MQLGPFALADIAQLAHGKFARVVVYDDLPDPLLRLVLSCYSNALSTWTGLWT